ncbi:ureidoglycolate lyase, partial [Streptococcus suis]
MTMSGSTATREIRIQPLTREAFQPFGDMIEVEGS